MSRNLELAAGLGAAALFGAGMVPLLRQEQAPDTWFSMQWPREVDEDAVLGLLRQLVSLRRPRLVAIEALSERGQVTDDQLALESARLVPAEGRADASVLWRATNDRTLLAVGGWPAAIHGIPITDPVQQWWDLRDLGGEDRLEAADRLRRAIIDKTLTTVA